MQSILQSFGDDISREVLAVVGEEVVVGELAISISISSSGEKSDDTHSIHHRTRAPDYIGSRQPSSP